MFARNARWATVRPVPELGSADENLEDIMKFYSYWVRFDSWRDFTGKDAEHNVESAQDREERRWMEQENKVTTRTTHSIPYLPFPTRTSLEL